MNNSPICFAIEDFQMDSDYFAGVYENRPFKVFAIILSIVGSIIVLPFLLGTIWNERFGCEEKRTVINNITGLLALSLAVYISTVQPLEIFRYLYGPLPAFFCFWFHVFRNAVTLQLAMLLDLIIIIRYLFVFWLKNPGNFYDNFWTVFIHIWTFGFCLITQWMVLYLPGNKPLLVCFCSGINLSDGQSGAPKNILIKIVHLCSFILLLAMFIRIEKFRQIDHIPTTWSGNQKRFFLSATEDKFISSYLIYLMVIVNMIIGNALVMKINSLTPYEANLYPNYMFVITFQLISPIEIAGSVVLVYYLKHKKLISTLITELKEFIRMQNNHF